MSLHFLRSRLVAPVVAGAAFVVMAVVWSPSQLRADQISDEMAAQIADQVADLKATSTAGSPLLLVSQGELDSLPNDTPVSWGSEPTSPEGPTIEISSPTHNATYTGPFPIKVQFLPGPKGYDVDIKSLKLEYKKAWGIDITDRVRDFVTGTVIDVEESELPRGRHTVEIEISDTAKNLSRQIFTVTVK
jgi:hypothetical protein